MKVESGGRGRRDVSGNQKLDDKSLEFGVFISTIPFLLQRLYNSFIYFYFLIDLFWIFKMSSYSSI